MPRTSPPDYYTFPFTQLPDPSLNAFAWEKLPRDTVGDFRFRSEVASKNLFSIRPFSTIFVHTHFIGRAFGFVRAYDPTQEAEAWLQHASEALRDFAGTYSARLIIGNGLLDYALDAAAVATLAAGQPAVQTNRRDGPRALARLGLTANSRLIAEGLPVLRGKADNVKYVPLLDAVAASRWSIPGIETPETRTMIAERFAGCDEPQDLVVSPTELIAAVRVAVPGELESDGTPHYEPLGNIVAL